MIVDAKDFGCFETATARRMIRQGRLSTRFDFLSLDAHRVFGRFHFAPRSIGIHLGKLSTEQQNLL
jgi:hypothetical protein